MFRQLYENAIILAKSFLRLGVKKSEFIAISLQSCPEWLYVCSLKEKGMKLKIHYHYLSVLIRKNKLRVSL